MGSRLYFVSLSSCLPSSSYLSPAFPSGPSSFSPTHKPQIANSTPTHRHIRKTRRRTLYRDMALDWAPPHIQPPSAIKQPTKQIVRTLC